MTSDKDTSERDAALAKMISDANRCCESCRNKAVNSSIYFEYGWDAAIPLTPKVNDNLTHPTCKADLHHEEANASLDFKNGVPFEASDEHLYKQKIEELLAEIDANEAFHIRVLKQAREIGELRNEVARLREALKFYADEKNWGETNGPDLRNWYIVESTDRGDKAREALESDKHLRSLETWK